MTKHFLATIISDPKSAATLRATLEAMHIDPAAIEAAMRGVTAAPPRPAAIKLRNRTIRKAGTYPCRRKPSGLHAAAITWPIGVPHEGCGRVFTSEKSRTTHESGGTWDAVRFPNGCLDRVLPADKRDTR